MARKSTMKDQFFSSDEFESSDDLAESMRSLFKDADDFSFEDFDDSDFDFEDPGLFESSSSPEPRAVTPRSPAKDGFLGDMRANYRSEAGPGSEEEEPVSVTYESSGSGDWLESPRTLSFMGLGLGVLVLSMVFYIMSLNFAVGLGILFALFFVGSVALLWILLSRRNKNQKAKGSGDMFTETFSSVPLDDDIPELNIDDARLESQIGDAAALARPPVSTSPIPSLPKNNAAPGLIRAWGGKPWQDITGQVFKIQAELYAHANQNSGLAQKMYELRLDLGKDIISWNIPAMQWHAINRTGRDQVVALGDPVKVQDGLAFIYYYQGNWYATQRQFEEETVFLRIAETRANR